MTRRRLIPIALICWAACVVTGFVLLSDHATQPGDSLVTPSLWPSDAPFSAPGERGTLLVIAHPQCPCTRATLAELSSALRGNASPPRIEVVLMATQEGLPLDLRDDLNARIGALPSAHVVLDPGARDAKRFGALTSGHVLLYAADGTLRFSGGITGSRGHEGGNAARFALTQALASLSLALSDPQVAPVYGCPLANPTS